METRKTRAVTRPLLYPDCAMRRVTTRILTPLLAAAAVSILTGCRPKEMQRCVDEKGNVVAGNLCAGQPQQVVQQQPDGHGGFHPIFVPMYRYYYGGSGGFGAPVFGGGYAPLAGHSYSIGGITRGGFGSSFGGGGE
jgi:hypothetical protein